MSRAGEAASRGRIGAVQAWLSGRGNTRVGRLAILWFRRYFETSRNSGSAATLYAFLSVMPFVLAVIGLTHAAGGDTNSFAARLIDHLRLTDPTAGLVRQTFGAASSNALAATLAGAVGFLIWGLGLGQIYQDVYARAWGITRSGSAADQGLFAIFFFVLSGAVAVAVVSVAQLRDTGWYVLVPVWLVASTVFWLWTPRFLLHRQVGLRALLPGALLASVVIGGACACAPLFLGGWLNSDGKYFGSFGVTVALLGWGFVLITISVVCAVFSPVWANWRQTETQPHDGGSTQRPEESSPASDSSDVPSGSN